MPEDIAYAALYLASDESLNTTGQNLIIDGGLTGTLRPRSQLAEGRKKLRKLLSGE